MRNHGIPEEGDLPVGAKGSLETAELEKGMPLEHDFNGTFIVEMPAPTAQVHHGEPEASRIRRGNNPLSRPECRIVDRLRWSADFTKRDSHPVLDARGRRLEEGRQGCFHDSGRIRLELDPGEIPVNDHIPSHEGKQIPDVYLCVYGALFDQLDHSDRAARPEQRIERSGVRLFSDPVESAHIQVIDQVVS